MSLRRLFKKKKTCHMCHKRFPVESPSAEVRLNYADGTLTLEVCPSCSDFLDKSADVMSRGREDEPL